MKHTQGNENGDEAGKYICARMCTPPPSLSLNLGVIGEFDQIEVFQAHGFDLMSQEQDTLTWVGQQVHSLFIHQL
jgi:hypothetical protein